MADWSRREFLKSGRGCAGLTAASFVASLLNLSLTRSALASISGVGGYKALVCLFQHGGNDSFNMLAPYEADEYADYAAVRSNLALPRSELLPITAGSGRRFGIHPGMPELRDLYESGKLAFVANVGSLIGPTDRRDYRAKRNLPLGLFSHSDQQRHWQTSVPQSRAQITGWAGRMADCLTDDVNANPTIAMNIALDHSNIFQTGDSVVPYVIGTGGATALRGYGANDRLDRILSATNDSLLEQTYSNLLEKTHARVQRGAIDAATTFNEATRTLALSTAFPATPLGARFEMVARTIGAREALGQTRQIFFVERSGWDNHDAVLSNQAVLLPEVSQALAAFYAATEELGVAGDVATFSASDFARTLSSNGNGSDHAWGGNHFVMCGNAPGGEVYGSYPDSLALGNALDIGRGRVVPTTSVDEYNAELIRWFGVPNDGTLETILPNIRNFYASGGSAPPMGFMG